MDNIDRSLLHRALQLAGDIPTASRNVLRIGGSFGFLVVPSEVFSRKERREVMEPSGFSSFSNGEVVGALSAFVGFAAFLMRKIKPGLANDDVSIAGSKADLGIIQRLEKECDRLAAQNTELADSVNRLQLETVKLSTENSKLHLEIIGLREENAELRRENKEMRKEREELMQEMIELKADMHEMSAVIKDLLSKKP
jgi:FtsZ-binding cell division protein ZapB